MSSSNRVARQAELLEHALLRTVKGVGRGRPVDQLLRDWFRGSKYLGSRDRRFLREAVFACWRRYGWLSKMEEAPLPVQAALAWRLQHAGALPEALMEANRELPDLPADLDQLPVAEQARILRDIGFLDVTPEDLLPTWALELAGEDMAPTLIDTLVHRPPTWLRASGGNDASLREWLLAQEATIDGESAPDAVAVSSEKLVHELGRVSPPLARVQDLASQAVVRYAAPAAGSTWWDLCCGAGGKALHLADQVGRGGRILATDPRREAVEEARRRLKQSQHQQVQLKAVSAEEADLPAGVILDGLLVDAPCSGSGVWGRQPDAPHRMTRRMVRQHAEQQVQLLDRATEWIPSGGLLVYAVCSVFPMEGAEQVAAFEARHSDFTREPAPHPLTGEPTDGAVLIAPEPGVHDGMFIARWRKQ